MAITRVAYGAFNNVFNAANQPSAPSFLPGDCLLFFTGEFIGSNLLTTPAGWTLLSPNNNAKQTAVFGLISVTGTEAMPSVSWGAQFSWTIVGVYRGVDPSLTVNGSGDRVSNSTINMIGPAGTVLPPVDGSLVLFVGNKNKTSASNASVFTAPTNFVIAAQQTQTSGGSITANAIAEWIQTTATTVPVNQAITGSVADATTQPNQGLIISLQPLTAPPPPVLATVGRIPRPGNPSLASPLNVNQFRRVAGVSQAPSITAPVAGQFSSNSTLYGPISRFALLSVGLVPQPGPGIGPFSNNQFETFTWATSNPSPTTALIAGQFASTSTLYGGTGGVAGQLNGLFVSTSTLYGEVDGLIAGSMSGLLVSASTAYASLGGTLDMSFALSQSNSTLTMLQIGGSFQPLVPFTAVVDVRLNIGYQPWKVVPEGTIG